MIWLIGSKGMLGSEVARQLTLNKIPWIGTKSEVDVTDFQQIEAFEKNVETSYYSVSSLSHEERKIKWIINCAAYTDVDAAEENSELAEKINCTGAMNVARLCRNIGAKLIHISTDYVFDGQLSSYDENAKANPLNVYGKTKFYGETAVEKQMNTYYIIRTSWLYAKEKSFVQKILKKLNETSDFSVVNNQKGCPTSAVNLASVIIRFIEKNENATSLLGKNSPPNYGLYNYCDSGVTTWYDFACEIQKLAKKSALVKNDCIISPCSSDDYKTKALRPENSVLQTEKIKKALKIKIPSWKVSLEKILKE